MLMLTKTKNLFLNDTKNLTRSSIELRRFSKSDHKQQRISAVRDVIKFFGGSATTEDIINSLDLSLSVESVRIILRYMYVTKLLVKHRTGRINHWRITSESETGGE